MLSPLMLNLKFLSPIGLSLLIVLSVTSSAYSQDREANEQLLDLNGDAIAVVDIHLEPLTAEWLAQMVLASESGITDEDRKLLTEHIQKHLDRLKELNITQFQFALLPVVPRISGMNQMVTLAIPMSDSTSAQSLLQKFESGNPLPFLIDSRSKPRVVDNLVILDNPSRATSPSSSAAGDRSSKLSRALAGNSSPISLVIVPSKEQLRVVRELGILPKETIDLFAQLESVRVTVDESTTEVSVSCRFDAKTNLNQEQAGLIIKDIQSTLGSVLNVSSEVSGDPEVSSQAIQFRLNQMAGQPPILAQIFGNLTKVAKKLNVMNRLKQIGLAMHTFYDKYGSFPPSASYNDAGQPLLSWRVHLLPFLDQQELYEQFHLDEPWDSEHNSQLINQIPDVFQPESLALSLSGRTTFCVPVGESTIFNGKTGVTFPEITDGTSNTVMVVNVPNSEAVVWTQPTDLKVDVEDLHAAIFGNRDSARALFGDGSARVLPAKLDNEALRAYFTRNGREVINYD
ncbi:hypothetical protein KOR42_24880 [Thalassoglobus neptunius]|uniref:DUF1559 domain-containing protein n=1 Tax=Thalassoglobus neptunius TaxID=1938619 RepID=A0A5C5X8Q6_9PLAN|nr:DUF1559 domain-containing protein [Thalassoglobus neptunius]TWT59099.1 hypothetical protein KOR42_24880 [Thalassoglobus neptunius]